MGKVLLLLSFLSLAVLTLAKAFDPTSRIFWMASASTGYQIIRIILATVLFGQLLTHPPRHTAFRMIAGIVAVLISGWAIQSTLNGVMPFLDSLSLLASATAIGVTALEVNTAEESKLSKSGNPLIA